MTVLTVPTSCVHVLTYLTNRRQASHRETLDIRNSCQYSMCFVIDLYHSQVQLDLVQQLWQSLRIKQ